MRPILLVEDNEDLRFIFAEVLRRGGYTVLEAGDGQVALDLLRGLDPAPGLVLLDLMMPRVSGLDVLREVAESQRLSGIPIVIVSANAESLRDADRPVLKKPVEPRSLLDVARRYLPEVAESAREVPLRRPSSRPPPWFVQTLQTQRAEGMVGPAMALKPLQDLKILVVEDDADSLDLLSFSLASKGAIVEGVQTAEAALASATQGVPDIVITDVELPDADGCSLLGKLRALPGVASVPAVALTGYATPSVGDRVRSAGFQHLLTKPVLLAELTQTLVKLTGRADASPSAKSGS
jgi:CheY-like chemotaxis protein